MSVRSEDDQYADEEEGRAERERGCWGRGAVGGGMKAVGMEGERREDFSLFGVSNGGPTRVSLIAESQSGTILGKNLWDRRVSLK